MIVASHSRGITFQEVERFAKKKGPRFTAFVMGRYPRHDAAAVDAVELRHRAVVIRGVYSKNGAG